MFKIETMSIAKLSGLVLTLFLVSQPLLLLIIDLSEYPSIFEHYAVFVLGNALLMPSIGLVFLCSLHKIGLFDRYVKFPNWRWLLYLMIVVSVLGSLRSEFILWPSAPAILLMFMSCVSLALLVAFEHLIGVYRRS